MAIRTKMSREQRAKQFMPFAALKGYEDALSKKETVTVPKIEVSDDYAEILDQTINSLQKGNIITVFYYSNDEYVKFTGVFVKIDKTIGYLQVVNRKIPISDIYSIDIEKK